MSKKERRESRERSKLIQESTIGTHVVNNARHASRVNVHFGSSRKASRANRGEIRHVIPATHSRESVADYTRRTHTADYMVQSMRRRRRKTVLVALIGIVLAIAVVIAVASLVFNRSVDGKMALTDESAQAVLVAPEDKTAAHYTLLVGKAPAIVGGSEEAFLIELVRIDPQNNSASFVSINPQIQVTVQGETKTLSRLVDSSTTADLVTQVSQITGVSIAHLVIAEGQGLSNLIDDIGGVEVTLPEAIDDPRAGHAVLGAGDQLLTGEQALLAMRAYNYADPVKVQAQVQTAIVRAALSKVADRGGFDSLATFDTIAGDISTDMPYQAFSEAVAAFAADKNRTTYEGVLPASVTKADKKVSVTLNKTKLTTFMEVLKAGENPTEQSSNVSNVSVDGVTVTVRNGGGVTGAAAQAAAKLQSVGYSITETGNTDSNVYDETLVIYRDKAYKDAAERVVSELGQGRTTDASVYYNFSSNILVIVGKNWVAVK